MTSEFAPIDGLFRRRMKTFAATGAALGIIRDGQPAHIKCVGTRDVKTGAPVTEKTRFCIASMTKSITAMTVALCVEDGAIEWDQPLRDILPDFKMKDALASERLTVRDFLSHRSGLPRHDYAWSTSLLDRRGILKRMRHLPLSADIRAKYQYCNLGYLVAACVVEQASGMQWEDFLRQRILEPADMSSRFWNEKHPRNAEIAVGYFPGDNGPRPGPRRPGPLKRGSTALAPAGSLLCTIEELLRWVSLHINRGEIDGQRVFPESIFDELHKPHIVLPTGSLHPRLDAAYCLGWRTQPHRGRRRLEHGGTYAGFRSHMAFLPMEKIGVAILTNFHCDPPKGAVEEVLDKLLGETSPPAEPPMDKKKEAPSEKPGQKAKQSKPRGITKYEGVFSNPGYGKIRIKRSRGENTLKFCFDAFDAEAKRVAGDEFELKMPGQGLRYAVNFRANSKNRIASATIPFEPLVEPIVFRATKK